VAWDGCFNDDEVGVDVSPRPPYVTTVRLPLDASEDIAAARNRLLDRQHEGSRARTSTAAGWGSGDAADAVNPQRPYQPQLTFGALSPTRVKL
jgi:hypothetical protein